MPFTPTHIVAIIPFYLLKLRLPFIALAVGAMIPDLPLFYPIGTYSHSHSWLGLLSFCLPAGLAMYYIFTKWGLQFFLAMCPKYVHVRLNRLEPPPHLTLTSICLICFAIIMGSATHIIWDAFTHKDAWGVSIVPALNQNVTFFDFSLTWYKALQYGSTIIGLPILYLFFILSLKRMPPHKSTKNSHLNRLVRTSVLLSFIILMLLCFLYQYYHGKHAYILIVEGIKGTIRYGIILFFTYAFIFSACKKTSPKPT